MSDIKAFNDAICLHDLTEHANQLPVFKPILPSAY